MIRFKSVVTWVLICSLSLGVWPAGATTSTCDTANFERFTLSSDGLSTLAVTKQLLTWQDAAALAKTGGGRLVVITKADQNTAIFSNLSSHFTVPPQPSSKLGKKAWIDLLDPMNSPAWSVEGAPPVVMPLRFSWVDDASAYSNWAPGQPDGYCTSAEQAIQQDHNCFGEPWATINTDGTWSDEGDHGTTPITLKGVVEWPNTTLDCAKVVTPPTVVVPDALDGAATGAKYCVDHAGASLTSLKECTSTVDGDKLCPNDRVSCNPVLEEPQCNTGMVLNNDRKVCEADSVKSCPDGGTVTPPTGTGVYACVTPFTKGCSSGYVLAADGVTCQSRPLCSQGIYNDVTNKCESPLQTTTVYTQATSGPVTIDKYYARDNVPTGASDYKKTAAEVNTLDNVRMVFGVANGAVVLQSICAWGGAGNNGCDSPNWNWWLRLGVDLTKTYSGPNLTVEAKYFGADVVQTCPDPTYPTLVENGTGPNWEILYGCQGAGVESTCYDYDTYAYSPCTLPGAIVASVPQYFNKYYDGGAKGIADLSEFLSCPNGYSLSNPLTASQCQDVKTLWGNNTGIQDCTNPAYQCQGSAQACPAGTTKTADGRCSSDTGAYCPTSTNGNITFESAGIVIGGDLCHTPYSHDCPPDKPYNSVFDTCGAMPPATVICPTGSGYNPPPIDKCDSIPFCATGVYDNVTNKCFNATYTCPIGDFPCKQIDPTTQTVPVKYCSPNACQSDTSGWGSTNDTLSGTTDKNNDGEVSASGSCLGQIYLYNGKDMRCRLKDFNGATAAWSKLVASIILSCTGLGAALAGAMLGAQAVQAATMMAQIIMAITNAAAAIVVNTGIEMATGTFNSKGALIGAGVSVVAAGMGAYFAPAASGGNFVTTASGDVMQTFADGSLGPILATGVSDALVSPMTALGNSASAMMNTPAFQTFLQGVSDVATTFAPTISQSMLGSFKVTKCCFPQNPLSASCTPDEIKEAGLAGNGKCHIVGAYCASTALGICMIQKETSCCYSSLLARVFQEQGRPLIPAFGEDGGWGTPRTPNCRGFTPEEFQQLNYSAMDMTEYEKSLSDKIDAIKPLLDTYMESLGSDTEKIFDPSKAVPIVTPGVTP